MIRALRSLTFTGEWPAGVYWSPGEVRAVPDAAGEPPPGIEPVKPPPKPKGATS